MTVRTLPWLERVSRRVMDAVHRIGADGSVEWLSGQPEVAYGVDFSVWAGKLPAILVYPGVRKTIGASYKIEEAEGEILIECGCNDPLEPWGAAWRLEADVVLVLTADRYLNGLFGGDTGSSGFIHHLESHVAADPHSRAGYAIVSMSWGFSFLWDHANP